MEIDDYVEHKDNEYNDVYFEKGRVYVDDESLVVSKESYEPLPDEWISNNQDQLYYIYLDIEYLSKQYSLLEFLQFSDFCDYMDYTNNYPIKTKIQWDSTLFDYCHKFKSPITNPPYKIFVSHMLFDIVSFFNYLEGMYSIFKFGPMEVFMELCYMYSSTADRIN